MDLTVLAKNYSDVLSTKDAKQKVVDDLVKSMQSAQKDLEDASNAVRAAYNQLETELQKGVQGLAPQELRNQTVALT